MSKLLVIPSKCPTCGSEVDVDRFQYQKGWTVVRCISKTCNWWKSGYVGEENE